MKLAGALVACAIAVCSLSGCKVNITISSEEQNVTTVPAAEAPAPQPEVSANPFHDAKVGDVVFFGTYEQDNDPSTVNEPITWRVLEVADGKAYAISVYALDQQPINSTAIAESIPFEESTLCAWLNDTFAPAAFTEEDAQYLCGRVGLLDMEHSYALDDEGNDVINHIDVYATPYAVSQGVFAGPYPVSEHDGTCETWVEDTVRPSRSSVWTTSGFWDNNVGADPDDTTHGVRPMICITTE